MKLRGVIVKKNKFLALTMLCSVLSGVSANAQEIKDSDSQKIRGAENSPNNEGDKNLEEKYKARDKKKGKVSRFVDLVIDHPILSLLISGGSAAAGEGVRRMCFKNKKEVWGVNKFGYNEQEDCIYRNPNGKINVVILGSKEDREKFIKKYKFRNKMLSTKFMKYSNKKTRLDLTEERAFFDNWNIIEKDCDVGEPNEDFIDKLNKELKNDVAALIIVKKPNEGEIITDIELPEVKNINIKGSKQTGEFSVCMRFLVSV